MTTYICWDDSGTKIEIRAARGRAAAQEYVDEGDWGESLRTRWVEVWVRAEDEDEDHATSYTIAIEPDEPDCLDGPGHDWAQPHALVGGCKENPGVRGHGGGITDTYACLACGMGRTYDSWAQNPGTGEQGLSATEYTPDQYDVDEDDELAAG